MNTISRGLIVLLALLAVSYTSLTHAMRCNGAIIQEDMAIQQVLNACGQPTYSSGDFWGDRGSLTYEKDDGSVWTITTLNGRVTDIDMGR